MSNPLIRPVTDEELKATVDELVDHLAFAFLRPAGTTMRRIAEVQVRYVLKGEETADSPYNPVGGFLYCSPRVRAITKVIAYWMRLDCECPAEDGNFLRRVRHLERLARGADTTAA